MRYRDYLLFCLVAFSAPLLGFVQFSAAANPNVVIIFTDDQGYGDVGCYGAESFETPHLDRMASEGMRFTDFYVPASVCTPSRAALLTGCYPMRLGLGHRVLFPFSDTGLNLEEITLAEILKEQGYATACVGKWHLGHHEKFLPWNQGFDRYFGLPYSNDMDGHYYKGRDFQSPPIPLYDNKEVIERSPDQRFLTRRYTQQAIQFIEENKGGPFFLYLPHTMPHRPLRASPAFQGRSELGLYGDVIEELDWSVGQVLDSIRDLDLSEDTLVIFTSDNGPVAGAQSPNSAGPLRGRKNTTWEGGMREPCIMWWPGKIPAAARCQEMVTSMDFLPTIAKLAGAASPANRMIDGRDIWPLMAGESEAKSPHKVFYYYRDERLQAVRSGPWKLHVFRPEWKGKQHEPLLYNLRGDIGETTNLADEKPEVVERLLKLAEEARRDLGDAVTGAQGKNVRPVGEL